MLEILPVFVHLLSSDYFTCSGNGAQYIENSLQILCLQALAKQSMLLIRFLVLCNGKKNMFVSNHFSFTHDKKNTEMLVAFDLLETNTYSLKLNKLCSVIK